MDKTKPFSPAEGSSVGPPGFGHVISLISVWFHGAVYHREASQQRAGNGADGVSGPRRVPAAPGVGGDRPPEDG